MHINFKTIIFQGGGAFKRINQIEHLLKAGVGKGAYILIYERGMCVVR